MSKKIYPSKYTDRKVTDSQYLVDEVCERIAKKEKKVLTYKYWNDPNWNKIFRHQIKAANELLKEVSCVAIMAYLRSVKGRNIYSLGLKAQILAGCKNSIYTNYILEQVQADHVEIDPFIEDIPEEDIDNPEEQKSDISLWEKLG